MTDLIKKIILTAAVLFSGIAPVLAHKDTSFNSPHKLELKPASFAEPGYQLAKSYWLGGADIDLGFKGDDDATVCQSRGYTTGSCGTNQEIVSYCGAGNQYHRCGCNDRIYRYDDITCGRDAYPDMSEEYVCKTNSSGSGKSDRCICYADDQRWIDGSCVFYCSQDSHCADDEICITSTGQCEFKDCEIYGCDGGQVCYNHYCEVPNCVNGGTSCVQGEKCDSVSKQCVEDPNTCPSGYQESACSDKQISDGSNHTTSSGKVCYACRAKTCDDLNCDSVRQTCNSAALICVDKAGCSSGDSTTACKSDQKSLGTYVADNGDTCYQCQNMTCQEQLEAAGYGIDGAFGANGTSVITKNITLNNFTNNKKYISLKGLSFSQCKYTTKPTVTLTQSSPSMSGVGIDNLNVSGSGSIVLNGTATVKDVDFNFSYLDISDTNNAMTRITFEGDVNLPGSKLTVYPNGKLTVMNNFYAYNGIEIRGSVELAYAATFKTSQDITLNQNATLSTEFSGVNSRGTVTAANLYSDGYIDFYRKNVTISGDTIINKSLDTAFCQRRSRPGDCLLGLSDASFTTKNLRLEKGAKFEPNSSTVKVSQYFTIYTVGTDFTATGSTISAKEAFIACEPGDVNKKYKSAVARLDKSSTWNFSYGDVLHMGRGESVICFRNGSKLYSPKWTRSASSTTDFDGARVEGADDYKNISYDKDGSGSKKLNYKNRGACSSYGT